MRLGEIHLAIRERLDKWEAGFGGISSSERRCAENLIETLNQIELQSARLGNPMMLQIEVDISS